jgi:hypothetical protein
MGDIYGSPSIDMRSLEEALNHAIDEFDADGVDLQKLCKTKDAELKALEKIAEVSPTTDVQRRIIIKRAFINCVNKRFVHQGG